MSPARRPYVDQPVVAIGDAYRVALEAAHRWTLPEPRLLRQGMNAIYGCADVVLRVGRATAPASAAHELMALLRDRGLPVATAVDGLAIDIDGFAITAWKRIETVDEPIDWRSVGAAVAAIHDVHAEDVPVAYPVPSPTTFPWWDFERMLAAAADQVDESALAGLRHAIDVGVGWQHSVEHDAVVCHGDVHPGNVMMTRSGPVLIDFDLLCRAAPAWDHAMLTTYTDRWGGAPDAYQAFADGYGRSYADDALTNTLASLRNVASTLMRVLAGQTDPAAKAEAERRLKFWRGDPDAPVWRAQ